MKEAKGFKWLILFLSQIIFSPLLQVILYKYVAVTQGSQQQISFFRTLLFIYLLPFLVSVFILIYTVTSKHNDIMKNPYQLKFSQIAVLSVLSIITIISDYSAVAGYAQMKNMKDFS
jgi:ABC-type transport system involved in cytochrome c biogenesis permease component